MLSCPSAVRLIGQLDRMEPRAAVLVRGNGMRHYLFVGERDALEVLGVWEVGDDLSAARLRLQLSLMYPDCKTVSDLARDYESLKDDYRQYDFGALRPEQIQLR